MPTLLIKVLSGDHKIPHFKAFWLSGEPSVLGILFHPHSKVYPALWPGGLVLWVTSTPDVAWAKAGDWRTDGQRVRIFMLSTPCLSGCLEEAAFLYQRALLLFEWLSSTLRVSLGSHKPFSITFWGLKVIAVFRFCQRCCFSLTLLIPW